MNTNTKNICERGKFFIETGTASTFKKFVYYSAQKIIQYVPGVWLNRIEDLINSGDRDKAIFLWVKVCCKADSMPSHYRRILVFYTSYFFTILLVLYAILKIL